MQWNSEKGTWFFEAAQIFAGINHEKVTNKMPFDPKPGGGQLYLYFLSLDNSKRMIGNAMGTGGARVLYDKKNVLIIKVRIFR